MGRYDAIVLGLGAVGSAATYHLARAGAAVLGIDRFSPPHRWGSSHGETRVTRLAIGEGIEFSPLALRSHELWRHLERETGETLLQSCGCLIIGGQSGGALLHGVPRFFENTLEAAKTHRIRHEMLDSAALRRRFPQFHVRDGEQGYFEHDGGYLFVERCIAAHLAAAGRHRADIRTDEKIDGFEVSGATVRVHAASGASYEAERLLITAGAWLPQFLPQAHRSLFTVTRQVLHWFDVRTNADRFLPASQCPVFIWQPAELDDDIYGFPALDEAAPCVKIAWEEPGAVVDPDHVDRTVTPHDIARMYERGVAPYLPDLAPTSRRTEVCLYTKVVKGRFVIDKHPADDRVLFASACSGHGFKHSAAIGEALAEQLCGRTPSAVDLRPFTLARLADI